jgi:hypothetical protein
MALMSGDGPTNISLGIDDRMIWRSSGTSEMFHPDHHWIIAPAGGKGFPGLAPRAASRWLGCDDDEAMHESET